MSRPHSLTQRQRHALRRLKVLRLTLIRELKELPSKAELAKEFNVSERTIGREMSQNEYTATVFVSLQELARW